MRSIKLTNLIGGVLLGLMAVGACGQLYDSDAMPPYPGLAEKPTPAAAAAIERYNTMRASFAARGIDQPGGGLEAGAQVTGSFNVLAVCVDFSDKTASVAATAFDNLIFASGSGSVRNYFGEVSYGNLDMVTVDLPSTLDWMRAPSTYATYVNGAYGMGGYPNNTQKLCEDLIELLDGLVDFSDYDNDHNGSVDGLVIVHTGPGAELTGNPDDIWSHKWGIWPSKVKDGVSISSYSVQPEYWFSPGDITIGVYAHEIGHLFGLPDLYDVDGSSRGIGRWSLMSSGSWNGSLGSSPAHLDAWCKTEVGWLTPTVIGANATDVLVPRVEDSARVYRVWSEGAGGSEYFLIANRQRVGYDGALPSAGLLIWHIDETKSGNNAEWYPGHTSSGNYLVALEQADGLWQMEQNSSTGNSGDPFPGSTGATTFSAATTPSSDAYSGTQTFVTVTNISASGEFMTCDLQVSLEAGIFDDWPADGSDHALHLANRPNPFNPATMIHYACDGAAPIVLEVYDILGRRVAQLASGLVTPGEHELEWDGRDDAGHPVASGVYFARLQSGSAATVRKMVLIR
ncbi:MAG TPA: M6 family metalloprotease domain-containing protein [Acidobacteriota bacterium]|nr:M6 family metalloprotease domain-containing protein [Acidobacteriota bacterium]